MKRNKLMITFLSSVAFTVGCKKETATSQQLERVQVKTEAAAQKIKDYSYESSKDGFQQARQWVSAKIAS